MFDGQMIYRDFFQFSTPGTSAIYFLLFKIFGLRLWIPGLSLLLLGLVLAALGVVISKKVMGPGLALLPSAIFLIGIYKNQLHPIHHWYSVALVLAALAVLMERRSYMRIAGAGALCGLAYSFTQTRGLSAAAALAVYFWWESRARSEGWRKALRKEIWLGGGLIAALVAVNAYFIAKVGLARYLWCTVVFGIEYHHQAGGPNTFLSFFYDLPTLGSRGHFLFAILQWGVVFVVVPLVIAGFFILYGRQSGERSADYWARPMLLAMMGLSLILSVAPAPSLGRMGPSILPGIILLGWFYDSKRRSHRALAALLGVVVVLLAPHGAAGFQLRPMTVLQTSRGPLALADPSVDRIFGWIQSRCRPGEYFFAAADPDVYFYLDLRNPTPVPFVTDSGYTTDEQLAAVIHGLEQHRVRYIFWDSVELGEVSPGASASEHPIAPLWNYMVNHYRKVKAFGEADELWERKD